MTAVDDSPGAVADALMSGVGSDYRLCVEYWRDRCGVAEAERDELGRRLTDSEVRRVELEGMYSRAVSDACVARQAAATAGAAAEALKGNR